MLSGVDKIRLCFYHVLYYSILLVCFHLCFIKIIKRQVVMTKLVEVVMAVAINEIFTTNDK